MIYKEFLPYNKQFIDASDVKAVVKVLQSDFLTTGPECLNFEINFARYVGSKYAVAVNNGTSALYLSMLALGIQKNDKVITSPNTFVADANVIRLVRADVLFSDIELDTGNLDLDLIESLIKKNKKVKAIIAVHFAGYPIDMKRLRAICKRLNILIVEDGCHALGSSYKIDRKKKYRVGSCKYSDLTTFSFHPIKNITTGEGGAITTNSKRLYNLLLQLRNHGITRNKELFKNKLLSSTKYKEKNIENEWYYESQLLSENFRITDFQCALGNSQLKKLNKFIIKRKNLVDQYIINLRNETNNEIGFFKYHSTNDTAFHLFCIKIDFSKIHGGRARIMNLLKKDGIGSQLHYIPIYKFPYYQNYFKKKIILNNTEKHYQTTLSLPLHYAMTLDMPKFIIKRLYKHITESKK